METRAWSPDKLLKVSGYYWKSFALHAAIKLGIFTIISSEELTGEDIARKLGARRRGVVMLLNALGGNESSCKEWRQVFQHPIQHIFSLERFPGIYGPHNHASSPSRSIMVEA